MLLFIRPNLAKSYVMLVFVTLSVVEGLFQHLTYTVTLNLFQGLSLLTTHA